MSKPIPDLENMPSGAFVAVAALAGRWDKCTKTIERWSKDETLKKIFPKIKYIRGRKYTTAGEALKFERHFDIPGVAAANKRANVWPGGRPGRRPKAAR